MVGQSIEESYQTSQGLRALSDCTVYSQMPLLPVQGLKEGKPTHVEHDPDLLKQVLHKQTMKCFAELNIKREKPKTHVEEVTKWVLKLKEKPVRKVKMVK